MQNTMIEQKESKGHFEVEFTDGRIGIAFYDKTLDDVIRILAKLDRKVKSIEWKED